jgi:alkanesulfonate monooxygenase SsuD/methylene tetrahydromethanopterin reductase-like flavin-dependent oxidoreductase (luciferase family)
MGRGFGIAAAVDNETVKTIAQAAEEAGYSSFWVNDTPGADGLECLREAASVTDHIKLGVGVIPINRRSADSIAEDVVGYDLPQDRLWLGIGSPGPKGALANARAAIDTLHDKLECAVILAALGPRMVELSGEISDGVLLNWITPSYAATSRERIEEAAKEAGRDAPIIMSYVRAGLLPEAEDEIMVQANRYASVPAYGAHFDKQGVDAHLTVLRGKQPAVLQAGIEEFEAVLDESVVRAITPDDEPDTILKLLDACKPARASA